MKAAAAGFDVAIVTGDKDFFQLVRDGIRVFNPRDEGTWYDAAGVQEKFGVTPDQVVDVLALMGDTIDNIKGVPGIGDKGARELISKYGSLENLIAHAAEITQKRYREPLLANIESARQSRELARIRTDVPVDFDPDALRYRGASRERCFRDLQRAGVPDAGRRIRTDREHDVQKTYRIVNTPRICAALAARLEASGRFALRVCRTGRSAMTASIVGLAFSTAPRRRRLRARSAIAARQPVGLLPLSRRRSTRCRPVLEDDPAIAKIGHDLKFDTILLARHGVELRGLDTDTMIASYLHRRHPIAAQARGSRARAHELQGAHRGRRLRPRRQGGVAGGRAGRGGASTTRASGPTSPASWRRCFGSCLKKEQLDEVYTSLELPLIPVLVAVERAGVRIDGPALAAQSQRIEQELARRTGEIFQMAGGEFNINSPKQLSEILFDKLQLPILKRTGTSRAPSTAVEVLEELALAHDLPRQILEWRALMKLKGTYIDALPQLVNPETGRVHTCFNQAVAATGRLSSSDPNLQNIPDQDRARPRDPPRVHRRAGPRADLGRLFADRAAGAGPSRRGRNAHRSLPPRRRHPRSDGAEGVRPGQRHGQARAAQHGQDDQLRAAVRKDRVHAGQGHRRHAAGGAGDHRRLFCRVPEGPPVHRPHARGGARHRRREDDVRPAPARAGADTAATSSGGPRPSARPSTCRFRARPPTS